MNLCSISEEGPESLKECNRGIEYLENIYKVIELGKQVLPSVIGYRVNVAYFEEHCFCKVKIKTDRRKFRQFKPEPIVYFYTASIGSITALISDIYGKFYDIDDGTTAKNHWDYEHYYKIGIPYKDLKKFLLDCIGQEIENLKDYKAEYLEIG